MDQVRIVQCVQRRDLSKSGPLSTTRLRAGHKLEMRRLHNAIGCGVVVLLLSVIASRACAQNPFRQRVYDNLRPEVRIPVYALGYQPPGELPAFQYYSLVSLHYVDSGRLLFTFNTTGLVQRDTLCSVQDSERLVRAVVLDLPSGKPVKQLEWKLYDFSNFLWGLGNGQFLFRRCSQLYRLDASLNPTKFIDLGGSLVALGISPDRSVLLTEEEPADNTAARYQAASGGALGSHVADSLLGQRPKPELDLSFIRLHPLSVIAHSQVPSAVDIPILAGGFLETIGTPQRKWDLVEQSYQNVQRQIASIHSFCAPQLTAITDRIFIAQMCPKSDQLAYQGFNLQGTLLWQIPFTGDRVLPRFIRTQDGAHFAIETLHASHPRAALDPLNSEVIDMEILDIYNTMTGTLIGSLSIRPVYTGGRNVDFSPDGTHIAVLREGAIEIYALDALAKYQQSMGR